MSEEQNPDIKNRIKITRPEKLYEIRDRDGNLLEYTQADGRQLFNHYRHNLTNYDEVLDEIRTSQGYVRGYDQKQASNGAAEQVLQHYRDEHVKVIEDAQTKGKILKGLMKKAGVGTASALSSLLDSWSEKIKQIAHLQNSQRSLQVWNDTYRVQRDLVKKLLKDEGVDPEVIQKVNSIYSTRSVNKAVEKGMDLFDLEKSEILRIVKSAIRYANKSL